MAGAVLTGANLVGLGLVALMLTTTDADASTRTAEPAATVPDHMPAEEQSRAGTSATATTQPRPELWHGQQGRACRCSPRPALEPPEGG
ncbi:hypothetical protein OG723_44000 (plasmid) [Streptomyces sp. NBC_01278]|uniref:hypothetical protein n=1 Tax=Streptomyces sp. NBC_01278 TaxID=2903809 RepID=UPI002E333969|nr:hypothetical protein [Streptomyces sp. NBC_01278]